RREHTFRLEHGGQAWASAPSRLRRVSLRSVEHLRCVGGVGVDDNADSAAVVIGREGVGAVSWARHPAVDGLPREPLGIEGEIFPPLHHDVFAEIAVLADARFYLVHRHRTALSILMGEWAAMRHVAGAFARDTI